MYSYDVKCTYSCPETHYLGGFRNALFFLQKSTILKGLSSLALAVFNGVRKICMQLRWAHLATQHKQNICMAIRVHMAHIFQQQRMHQHQNAFVMRSAVCSIPRRGIDKGNSVSTNALNAACRVFVRYNLFHSALVSRSEYKRKIPARSVLVVTHNHQHILWATYMLCRHHSTIPNAYWNDRNSPTTWKFENFYYPYVIHAVYVHVLDRLWMNDTIYD